MESGQRLVIPRNLLERAKRLAQRQDRQVRDVVAEALERGLPLLERQSIPAEWEQESGAFRHMHPTWRTEYAGEYVAVYQGELIDHDPAFGALLERVSKLYPDEFVLIRPVQDEPEIIYDHRSVRWAEAQQ